MIVKHIKVGMMGTNCYIFGDEETKEVAVVDPGDDGEAILDVIERNQFKVKYIILTHGHFDHIGAVKFLKEKTGAEILIHRLDSEMLIDSFENLSTMVGMNMVAVRADKLLEDGQKYDIGGKSFSVIHTPGHTKGGICILFDKYLFSGDTLFMETVGRTDLPHSNHHDILKSLNKLLELDGNINVFPGHGDSSTIEHEQKYNPFIS